MHINEPWMHCIEPWGAAIILMSQNYWCLIALSHNHWCLIASHGCTATWHWATCIVNHMMQQYWAIKYDAQCKWTDLCAKYSYGCVISTARWAFSFITKRSSLQSEVVGRDTFASGQWSSIISRSCLDVHLEIRCLKPLSRQWSESAPCSALALIGLASWEWVNSTAMWEFNMLTRCNTVSHSCVTCASLFVCSWTLATCSKSGTVYTVHVLGQVGGGEGVMHPRMWEGTCTCTWECRDTWTGGYVTQH